MPIRLCASSSSYCNSFMLVCDFTDYICLLSQRPESFNRLLRLRLRNCGHKAYSHVEGFVHFGFVKPAFFLKQFENRRNSPASRIYVRPKPFGNHSRYVLVESPACNMYHSSYVADFHEPHNRLYINFCGLNQKLANSFFISFWNIFNLIIAFVEYDLSHQGISVRMYSTLSQ